MTEADVDLALMDLYAELDEQDVFRLPHGPDVPEAVKSLFKEKTAQFLRAAYGIGYLHALETGDELQLGKAKVFLSQAMVRLPVS